MKSLLDSGSQTVNRDPLVSRGFGGKELLNTLVGFVKDKALNCILLYSRCLRPEPESMKATENKMIKANQLFVFIGAR
ncbi:hypothetical protein T4D_9512 [Trichinella pseudospiralis]|uniref:Uncharacterized protein n=1 Tax=Trichinella pseudospiralis TaxID=6337 RepID=A0A0V1FL14_TRIPS|nr:hypothetical protein T4D_9512 [Trichinella pseudospiralis]